MHIIYTDRKGNVKTIDTHFPTIGDAENWLKSIQAACWEIGI